MYIYLQIHTYMSPLPLLVVQTPTDHGHKAVVKDRGVCNNQGPNTNPKIVGPLLEAHERNERPIYGKSYILGGVGVSFPEIPFWLK